MTIDERLEALTQSVELMAHMQQENEKRFAQVTHNMEILHDSIKRLENIAVAHEQRLESLPKRL
jgi:peptidoglycan hydrolase CwlO-like protein